MAMHLGDCMGRKIKIETAQRDDGKYYFRSVQVESRADDEVVIDEMPYLGMAHVDEGEVVAVATIDVAEYVKSRF
jgi:hypothetical protein